MDQTVFFARSAVMLTVSIVLYVLAEVNEKTYAYLMWTFTAAAFIRNTEKVEPVKAPLLGQRLRQLKLPWEHH